MQSAHFLSFIKLFHVVQHISAYHIIIQDSSQCVKWDIWNSKDVYQFNKLDNFHKPTPKARYPEYYADF